MPFDISIRLYSLLAERIKFPICKEKRSDTICIKPIVSLMVEMARVELVSE
jgi:hypothetical protein